MKETICFTSISFDLGLKWEPAAGLGKNKHPPLLVAGGEKNTRPFLAWVFVFPRDKNTGSHEGKKTKRGKDINRERQKEEKTKRGIDKKRNRQKEE